MKNIKTGDIVRFKYLHHLGTGRQGVKKDLMDRIMKGTGALSGLVVKNSNETMDWVTISGPNGSLVIDKYWLILDLELIISEVLEEKD